MQNTNNVKIELDQWWGKKSAFVKGDLVVIQKNIQDKLTSTYGCKIDTSRKPHIEITDDTSPQNPNAYKLVNGSHVDISDVKNWEVTKKCIMLKCGKVKFGTVSKNIHFTIAFSNDIANLSVKNILKLIENVLCQMNYKIKFNLV